MKCGIVGSRKYENRKKIKDFIFELKKKFKGDLTIVSGGCKNGADHYAKKYALEFDLQYEEYPPFHELYNLYCVLPEHLYEKPYRVSNYFVRNKQIAKNSDMIVAFIPEGTDSPGALSTIKYAKKFNKKALIII
tara:strand:+ start:37 stop:438 length:402 start_codon:yes stop_codon:yes gene_type:complete